jgi:hypothetical protein
MVAKIRKTFEAHPLSAELNHRTWRDRIHGVTLRFVAGTYCTHGGAKILVGWMEPSSNFFHSIGPLRTHQRLVSITAGFFREKLVELHGLILHPTNSNRSIREVPTFLHQFELTGTTTII